MAANLTLVRLAAEVVALIPNTKPGVKTFFFAGGSLHWRGNHLPVEEALRLRDLYEDAARKAYDARDVREARKAAAFWTELTQALDGLDHHNRCIGKPSPFASLTAELTARFDLASTVGLAGDGEPRPPTAA